MGRSTEAHSPAMLLEYGPERTSTQVRERKLFEPMTNL
jgi:hypothetical protein